MNLFKKIIVRITVTFLVIFFPFIVFTLIASRSPMFFDIRSFVVLSGSMEPTFPVGSIVYAKKSNDYRTGETITFKTNNEKYVTHRIVQEIQKEGQALYVTQGDANNSPDSTAVNKSQIIGKVFFFMPYLGQLVNTLKSPMYFIGIIIIPSIIFIGVELWAIKREIVKSTEKRILESLNGNLHTEANL